MFGWIDWLNTTPYLAIYCILISYFLHFFLFYPFFYHVQRGRNVLLLYVGLAIKKKGGDCSYFSKRIYVVFDDVHKEMIA